MPIDKAQSAQIAHLKIKQLCKQRKKVGKRLKNNSIPRKSNNGNIVFRRSRTRTNQSGAFFNPPPYASGKKTRRVAPARKEPHYRVRHEVVSREVPKSHNQALCHKQL
ncbi:hypothetical protein [Motiliproteus sp. SC1-56]|uniref:hypothetical protein n=1 Tax=Motiliproteus sp. SC1-56 TaxID=2799565 RepID=UPI001A8E9BF4|nr:hypothetical protein [Motiliproteus sp. SC1-56]